MPVVDAEVDERALIVNLTVLRRLIEEEHALEVDRAACIPPLAFETANPVGDANRTYRFVAGKQPARADLAGATLKIGDGVDIVLPDGCEAGPFGVISAFNGASVVVEFGRPVRNGLIPPRGTLRARVDDNQRTIRLQAIERVVRERHSLGWVGAVLTEASVAPLAETTWDPSSDMGVTDGQRRALVGASASQDLFLIQGPPGTGKTSVIAALLRYFARGRGARVLLSSKSHRPIDNALDRLGQGELHVLRLGQAGKVTGAGQEVRFADVLAQAEQDVPQRHLAARTELEAWLQSLSVAERLLAKLQALNDRLGASEPTIPHRVAEIEPERPHAHQAIRRRDLRLVHPLERERAVTGATGSSALDQLLRPLHRIVNRLHKGFTKPSTAGPARPAVASGSEDWLVEQHRVELGREDGVTMGEHATSELRTHHQRLWTRAESALSSVAPGVRGLQAPPLSIATVDETRTSLIALRRVLGQARSALHELEAWGAAIGQPGGVANVLVETAEVIAATAVGVDSGRDGARIAELEFDVAIVDEAGQAQLTDLIVPFSRARIVILVGDHQQLPPYLDNDLVRRCADKGIDTTWVEKSVFEHLWDRLPESHRARLDVQFRMPEVIASFLGREFYAGELQSATAKQGTPPVCSLFQAAVVLVDTSGGADRGETAVSRALSTTARHGCWRRSPRVCRLSIEPARGSASSPRTPRRSPPPARPWQARSVGPEAIRGCSTTSRRSTVFRARSATSSSFRSRGRTPKAALGS